MARDQFSPEVAGDAVHRGESVVPSRRSVLRGAAGVGAAGIAATAFAGLGGQAFAAAASESRDAGPHADSEHDEAGAAEAATAGPVVAHVRDAATGRIDLFRGTSQVQVRDPDLAARLVRAAGTTSEQVS